MATRSLPSLQKVVRLAQRPVGMVKPGVDLVLESSPVLQGPLRDGEFVVRNLWLSLDPAMRGWMSDAKSYIAPVGIGDVMRGGCVAEVVDSKNPGFKSGDLVTGMFGWQQYAHVTDPKALAAHVVHPIPGLRSSVYMGALGMTGMTAYFGLLEVGKPKPGDTVVVTAAAGATGSVVVQIAKHVIGCRVVGVAGGPEKVAWLKDIGCDDAVDYKACATDADFFRALKAATPEGINVVFDNVGGVQLDAMLSRLNQGSRVAICGAISQYNVAKPVGPAHYLKLLTTRSTMSGFIVFDYAKKYREAAQNLAQWMLEGKIQHKEDIVKGGVEIAADTLLSLFSGANKGKLLVQMVDDADLPPSANASPTSKL